MGDIWGALVRVYELKSPGVMKCFLTRNKAKEFFVQMPFHYDLVIETEGYLNPITY